MDVVKGKWTKNLITKAWKRCSTLPKQRSSSSKVPAASAASLTRSKSWSSSTTTNTNTSTSTKQQQKKNNKAQVAPVGCFTVYVGPEKQRFVVRMQFVNHRLFKILLEDAALEYGYKIDGPILLPCDVDFFCNVLAEMESNDDSDDDTTGSSSSCSPISFSPSRRRSSCGGSNRGYRMLTPTSSSSSSLVVT